MYMYSNVRKKVNNGNLSNTFPIHAEMNRNCLKKKNPPNISDKQVI